MFEVVKAKHHLHIQTFDDSAKSGINYNPIDMIVNFNDQERIKSIPIYAFDYRNTPSRFNVFY